MGWQFVYEIYAHKVNTAYQLWEKKFGGLVEASLVSITSIFLNGDWTRVHDSSMVKGHSYVWYMCHIR